MDNQFLSQLRVPTSDDYLCLILSLLFTHNCSRLRFSHHRVEGLILVGDIEVVEHGPERVLEIVAHIEKVELEPFHLSCVRRLLVGGEILIDCEKGGNPYR